MTVKTRKPKTAVQKTDIVLGELEREAVADKAHPATCSRWLYCDF